MSNKSIKSSYRLTPQISAMLENAAADLHKSKSDVLALAIFTFWQDHDKFIICPGCKKKRWVREEIPFQTGEITKMECECGTRMWWDDDEGRIVKVKKSE